MVCGRKNQLVRLEIPIAAVWTLTAVIIAFLSVFGYLVAERGRRMANTRRLRSLAYENRLLKDRMGELEAGIDSLRAALRDLTELDVQLRLLANMPLVPRDVRTMGIGGGNVGSPEPGAELQSSIEWLLEQARFQRASFYDIANYLEKAQYLQNSTPSIIPTSGWITSGFGYRRNPFGPGTEMHPGIDIVGIPGQPIVATAAGTVVMAGRYQNWGNVVELDHGRGLHTFYAHCASVLVKPGDQVKRGQTIATLGSTGRSTGNHCHYGVKVNGNWVDPKKYLLAD